MARQEYKEARRADFSPAAVKQAVVRKTLQKPYVLYPAAIGILGIAASLLIAPWTMFLVPAVLGSTIGAGAWLIDNTLRREKHARDYLDSMHALLGRQLDDGIQALQADFAELHYARGTEQVQRLAKKFRTFQKMLQRKLEPGELTHARYLGMTEQVFLAGLDNLGRAADLLRSTSAISPDELRRRIRELRRIQDLDTLQQRELQALESRILTFDNQQRKVAGLLTENEEALTQIDLIMAAIADMDTQPGRASVDMETAMQELKVLAERASRYSRSE